MSFIVAHSTSEASLIVRKAGLYKFSIPKLLACDRKKQGFVYELFIEEQIQPKRCTVNEHMLLYLVGRGIVPSSLINKHAHID